MLQLTAEECRGSAGRELPLALTFWVCVYMSVCSSFVSIDPRRVESGDGAVAG